MLAIFSAKFLILVSFQCTYTPTKIFFHYFSAQLTVVLCVRYVILHYLDALTQHSDTV